MRLLSCVLCVVIGCSEHQIRNLPPAEEPASDEGTTPSEPTLPGEPLHSKTTRPWPTRAPTCSTLPSRW